MNEPLNPLASLIAAKELIKDPANWTQEAYARDARGNSVQVLDPTASCFCSVGALYRANEISGTDQAVPGRYFLRKAAIQLKGDHPDLDVTGPMGLNDHTDHECVMEMFDLAIRLAQHGAA